MNDRKKQKEKIMIIEMSFTFMIFCCCFPRLVIAFPKVIGPKPITVVGSCDLAPFSVQYRSYSTESWRNLLWGDQAQDNVHTSFDIDLHDHDIIKGDIIYEYSVLSSPYH